MFTNLKLFRAITGFSFRIFLAFILFVVPFIFLGIGNITTTIIIFSLEYSCNLIALILALSNQRSEIQSKISWTFLFIFVPGGGALIYFSGGMVPLWKKWKLKKTELLENDAHKKTKYFKENIELNQLFPYNFIYQSKPVTYNNELKILYQGREKYPQLLKDLQEAKEFINFQYFIINDGIIFKQIEKILIEKKLQGVEVRILTDQVGSIATSNKTYKNLQNNGIKFAQFNPINLTTVTGYANYRSHNKFVIIDNKVAFFGGLNIGDEYAGIVPKYGTWFDIHLRVEGDIVDQMNKQFQIQWRFTTKEIITNQNKTFPVQERILPIQLFTDGPQYKESTMLTNFLNLLNNAEKKVVISSPYLVFPNIILNAFAKAIKRGVVVEIITIGLADKKTAYYASKYYADKLVNRGVKVYRMNNIFNHAKFFLFDHKIAIIGTSNLDYRALYLHFETNLLIQNSQIISELEETFVRWKTLSYELTGNSKNWKIHDFLFFIFWKLFSPVL